MANDRSFGRRGNPSPPPTRSMKVSATVVQATTVGPSLDRPVRSSGKGEFSSSDDDLRQWKLARKLNFEIPWRPLSLMATLCFGVASFALPDSVNDNVQWLLYALAAASLYAGFRKRRQHAKS